MNETITPGRRTLRFDSFDDVMPDVERLLAGCTTVGHWSLGQICRHLAMALRVTVDLPATTPQDPTRWVTEARRRQIFERGFLPEGATAPARVFPTETRGERTEAEGLRRAIAYYRSSPGPVIPHVYIGPMTTEEWERFHLMHCAHHLSFAVPTG